MPPAKIEPNTLLAEFVDPMRSWSIEMMFTCMLRFKSVRQEALLVLNRGYFNKPGEGYLAYLFELIRRLHPAYDDRQKIPFLILSDVALNETLPLTETEAGLLAQDETEKLVAMPWIRHPYLRSTGSWGLIYRSYKEVTDDDVSCDQGYQLLIEFVRERGYFEPLRAALTNEAARSIANWAEFLASCRAVLERAEAIAEDPFGNLSS
jgi:hypothetical protein